MGTGPGRHAGARRPQATWNGSTQKAQLSEAQHGTAGLCLCLWPRTLPDLFSPLSLHLTPSQQGEETPPRVRRGRKVKDTRTHLSLKHLLSALYTWQPGSDKGHGWAPGAGGIPGTTPDGRKPTSRRRCRGTAVYGEWPGPWFISASHVRYSRGVSWWYTLRFYENIFYTFQTPTFFKFTDFSRENTDISMFLCSLLEWSHLFSPLLCDLTHKLTTGASHFSPVLTGRSSWAVTFTLHFKLSEAPTFPSLQP